MPTLHIKIKVGDAEIEIKADGTLDKDTVNAIRSVLAPVTSKIAAHGKMKFLPDKGGDTIRTEDSPGTLETMNLYAKFKDLIPNVFKYGQWFTSLDAKEAFHDTYGILLKPSTVTTYLRRMEEEGILISRKQGRLLQFRVATPLYAIVKPESRASNYEF